MAEEIQDVSVISHDLQGANHSPRDVDMVEFDVESDDPFDGLDSELLSLIVPEALYKLFTETESSATAVEGSGIDDRAVTTTDDHGLCKVARILQHTITTLDQWLYETPEGKAFLRTILQELPEIKEFMEGVFRNILLFLAQRFGQLKDRSHPHFQEIEQWFSSYHVVLKPLVNFLHGALMALVKSDACSGRSSSLDVARIVKEIAENLHHKITAIGQQLFETSEGLALLRAILLQIPAQARLNEKKCRDLLNILVISLVQLKDGSNPLLAAIERWFADSHVLTKVTVESFYGGVLGLVNNEACQELGTQDLPTVLKEMVRVVAETSNSINQWFLETTKGMAILKPVIMESLVPIRPHDNAYRNFLQFTALHVINLKNASHPLFQSIERFLESDHEVLTMFVKAFHACLAWSLNNRAGSIPLYIDVLWILYQINERIGYPVSRRLFWLNGLESSLSLGNNFLQYVQNSTSTTTSKVSTWIDVPFLLNVRTKWKFLSFEAVHIMEQDMVKADKENSIRRQVNNTIYATWFPQAQLPIIPTSLRFHVDRNDIFQSAIENVDKYWQESESSNAVWLKPLEINFEGESAVDFGGPSKDFFHQFFSVLLESNIPVFKKIDDDNVTSDVWFNPGYLDYKTLEKIGLLFALLIFNGAVTTVPFPVLLYEKLLSNRDLIPTDLEKIDEGFVRQLYKLREMVPEDLEALELETVGPDTGDETESVQVTKENLELYITDTMNKRLAIPQVKAFATGFNRVASMTPLMREIFKAEDLRDVILGEELDWKAFRHSARYQFPYFADHPVIKMFWKVFEDLEERDKRGFLKFLTGADHVPVGGFVPFPVRRLNNRDEKYRHPIEPDKYPEPGDLMPEVMTCRGFLSMDLPEYQTEEDLRYRLMLAINVDGFHREAPLYFSATAPCFNSPMLQRVVRAGMQLACGGMR